MVSRTVQVGAATILGLFALAGCGNAVSTDIVGALGVSVDGAGRPEVLVAACSGSIDRIELYGEHIGGENTAQKPIGVWLSAKPVSGEAALNLDNPGPTWTVKRDPGSLRAGVTYIVLGGSSSADEAVSQVDFTTRKLSQMSRENVLSGRRGTYTRGDFQQKICD